MRKSKKVVSRSIGVEIGAICSKYFLKSRHLHYGYWTSDLEVDIANLRLAQENYARFLISHIPAGVDSILDVGCGSGQIAKMLLDAGYQVDCVSPSPYLSGEVRRLLGTSSHVFECFYEELETDNRYDLILFSESFQYIKPEQALGKTLGFLNKGGHILICDIFKRDTPDKSLLPGGHRLKTFYSIVSQYPLKIVEELDITEQTAPTLDIANDALNEVVKPSVDLAQQFLNDRYPLMSRCLKFLYRKRISRISEKYFSGAKTGENFKKFKSYRLLLYRQADVTNEGARVTSDGFLEV
jgi:SAM-dependent methyltransferase